MSTEQSLAKAPAVPMRIAVAPGVSVAWAREVCDSRVYAKATRLSIVACPSVEGTREAVVKLYLRRRSHGLVRRLLTSRAAREARGYEEFQRRGMPTARLLFWGEARRFGLFQTGIIATVRIDAEPVHAAYAREPDERLLESVVDVLVAMHRAGLCHGDPRVRNFLATRPVPTVIDLAAWSPMRRRAHLRDLTRFLGSSAALAGSDDKVRALLRRYASAGPALPCAAEELLARAERYRREEGEP